MGQAISTKSNNQKNIGDKRVVLLFIRQISIFAISLAIVSITVLLLFNSIYREVLRPVDPWDSTQYDILIPRGSSLASIAEILYSNELIRNEFAFEMFAQFTDQAHRLRSGTYELSRDMNMQQIIDRLMVGVSVADTIRFRIPEGSTVATMAELLSNLSKENGDKAFSFSAQDFENAAKNIDSFVSEFPFLENIPEERRQKDYPLEGYLFPDTYEAFVSATPDDIIKTMLRTFRRRVYERDFNGMTLAEKATELGMTIDEVIVLASVVQIESGLNEFQKVAAVFHNRLQINMLLQSCATVLYTIPREEWEGPYATAAQIQATRASLFNTYIHLGLPIGPISAPSVAAVEATLSPHSEFMNQGDRMLFFVARGDGTHVFSRTLEEHNRAVARYEYRWRR